MCKVASGLKVDVHFETSRTGDAQAVRATRLALPEQVADLADQRDDLYQDGENDGGSLGVRVPVGRRSSSRSGLSSFAWFSSSTWRLHRLVLSGRVSTVPSPIGAGNGRVAKRSSAATGCCVTT